MLKKFRREAKTGRLYVKGSQNDRDDTFVLEMLDEFGGYKSNLEKVRGQNDTEKPAIKAKEEDSEFTEAMKNGSLPYSL